MHTARPWYCNSFSSTSAKNARRPIISLPSLRQYYFVAMATSLQTVQVHHLHVECFHTVKRLRKSVQYIQRYSTKCASFLVVSYLTFTNNLCQLGTYWTEFHEIFTRYRDIIYAVNPSVAMVFFKTYVAMGGGVNDPPGVSLVLCHLEIKFQRLYPCFQG